MAHFLFIAAEGPSPPPTKSKRLRKRTVAEYVATEGIATAPTATSDTDEELREGAGRSKIPTEVIAESIALAQKQQEDTRAGLTSSELALFEDPEAEHSTVVPAAEEQAGQSAFFFLFLPIHSFPSSSTTASFADPELVEFEAMDLDAQLDKLEKLSSPPGKAKSRAVEEVMERLKIWQSAELELDEDRETIDQLMKDLDLLHRQIWPPNLYLRLKAELDQMVAGYKEAKATADKLEKQIEELQKQLAECREVQSRLRAGLSSKTKATFLVQRMVAAPRPALEITEASIHQGVLLQKELSIKKVNLQETLRKLGF
ncbi:unnamed protein product [Prunus brigantina]